VTHPVAEALGEIGVGWLEAFADQGFEEIAGVVQLTERETT
jgi:hypothetical protein